jgi:hypothetical protein
MKVLKSLIYGKTSETDPLPSPAEKPRPAPHPQPEADDHAGDARISQGELVQTKVEEASSTGDVQSTETNESKCSP